MAPADRRVPAPALGYSPLTRPPPHPEPSAPPLTVDLPRRCGRRRTGDRLTPSPAPVTTAAAKSAPATNGGPRRTSRDAARQTPTPGCRCATAAGRPVEPDDASGETWAVPARPNLLLTTGNAGGTELVVDGMAAPPLGGTARCGAICRSIQTLSRTAGGHRPQPGRCRRAPPVAARRRRSHSRA